MLVSPTFTYAKILQNLDNTSGIPTNILYEKQRTIFHSISLQCVPLNITTVMGFHRGCRLSMR